ncbi:BEL1-like homeodomain protein 1 isoform X2 [Macadamia integrifolia]|uniref:BEL1-like homeodomain protein 1 isoform X2 n=1 Tax=Macadamia integrifolia TaxID=60698 RepID=UPI001C528BEB|nr:BEL1-like homeodomain protein 1 isoform X2 [Macadamia integrifolia]
MATYFHGPSEIQADGLQTLYLMNPGYVGYSDAQAPTNMLFLNSAGNTLNSANLPHHPPPPQPQPNHHLVGIPLHSTTVANAATSAASQDPSRQSVHAQNEMSIIHGFVPRVHYNLWTSIEAAAAAGAQQTTQQHQIPTTAANNSVSSGVTDVSSQLGLRRSVMPPSQQALSLSLSPQQSVYGSYRPESDISAAGQAPALSPTSGNDMRMSAGGGSSSPASAVPNGISGMQSVLLGSKYLKAAQQLLDEVVNVGNGIKNESSKGVKGQSKINRESTATTGEGSSGGAGGGETSTKRGAELTTAERQELQMKKAKLVSMLDEVEQRYRHYHHQMQIVVSSFEQAAGFGSAKTYTALALQTISKQFRCLKDAISAQIRTTSKSLGEEECLGGKSEGSRLRFVDHQLRQQRALQQLGMMQHNAWRPQRGLPERSVSVLRAWLFEHFLHPYPKDSDKHMLAKQTGLTRSQVSNWFINARVRLWKPMVEEMYTEELKEQEQNGGSEEKTSKSELNEESTGTKLTAQQENSPVRADQRNRNLKSNEGLMQGSPKKSRTTTHLQNSPGSFASMDMDVKPGETNNRDFCAKFDDERQSRDGYSLLMGATSHGGGGGGGGGGFGGYSIGELAGRFDPDQFPPPRFSGNGVSLTLGLPHCENLSLSGTHQQTYLSNQNNIQLGRRVEMAGTGEPNDYCGISNTTPTSHSTAAYENINLQNRKRFAAQLLPDFVA